MKILIRVLAAVIALIAIWFALANRGPVAVSFDPLPAQVELPIYLLIFLVLALGILVGGTSHWFATAHRRGAARDNKRRLVVLERELDDLHDQRAPVPADKPSTKIAAR